MAEPGSSAAADRPVTELELDQRLEGDDRAVIDVKGELDLHTAPRLKDALFEVIAAGRTHVVLECAELRFVDSTGLGVLVAAHKRAAENGGEVRVESPSRILSKLLSITKLDAVFMP